MRRPRSPSRLIALSLALVFGLGLLASASIAVAQSGGAGSGAPRIGVAPPTGAGDTVQLVGPDGKPISVHVVKSADNTATTAVAPAAHESKIGALFFWLFALLTVGGAVFVVTRRNLIAAVMGMVGTFFAVAATYAMLYAHFLAVVQVLVYAGAIMVLFVFVIMILNRPEDEPWGMVGLPGKALAGLGMAYLLYRLATVLWTVKVASDKVASPGPTIDGADWGSAASVGRVLFTDYLFLFEAISLVLLVAVVGAIAVARPHQEAESGEPGDAEDGSPPGSPNASAEHHA